jgi:hypothetical protein
MRSTLKGAAIGLAIVGAFALVALLKMWQAAGHEWTYPAAVACILIGGGALIGYIARD